MLGESINADFDVKPQLKSLGTATATQLTTAKTSGVRGVLLRADIANGEAIYIGNDNTVSATVGWTAILMPLDGTLLIPIADASKIWLYSTGVTQKVGWSVL